VKILALTNLYPPHLAGAFDHRCQKVADALRMRGHTVYILTSNYGLRTEQRDEQAQRRLLLNGAFGQPLVTSYPQLKSLELHNNRVLMEALEEFAPEVVHVFSLQGVSKSLLFTLRHAKVPVVFDVHDHWLSANVREDPWLRFWNSPALPLLQQSSRTALEMSGERGRLDDTAPTRVKKGYDRLPVLFAEGKDLATVEPNSIAGFQFDHIYFCSQALKSLAEKVGFCVRHAQVIYPGIAANCVGAVKPAGSPMTRFLIACRLAPESGVMTALKALKIARQAGLKLNLSIYGRGESNFVAELRSFALAHQLPVEFLTASTSANNLASVYKQHDVLIHPPEWAEPFPFTPLEAMGCGLPVIASTPGGAEELFRHGENSLTYPPGDAPQLAARIQELLISPSLRQQMAETAQNEVLSKFNDSTVTDQLENFLANSQTQTN